MAWSTLLAGLSILVAFLFFLWSSRSPLPPGPPSLPILGVALKHPKTEFWKTYALWGRQYGHKGIMSFHVLGRRMIVLNTAAAAQDLLAKRSNIYSNRPFPTMAGLLMRREKSMFYISYNERFTIYRKLLHRVFNSTAAQNYWHILEHEACCMVTNILKSPQDLIAHVRMNAASGTMKIAYGYQVTGNNDHFVALAQESMRVASLAAAPGKWLVDSFPFLRFLPDWAPGAGFKRQAKAWDRQLYVQSLEPHNFVKENLAAGTAKPSFTAELLQNPDDSIPEQDYEDIVLWTAGAIYAAGADTTVTSVTTFLFTMMIHPDIQKRAQQEVDDFVGAEHRLPTLKDRHNFPYVECVLKEVLRWHPGLPMGLFHCASSDDEYDGYLIPAKTTVIPNIWAMMHDEEVYPEPDKFVPDRFWSDGKQQPPPDPREFVFGFGRRVCAGQEIANATIFIQMVMILATMDISKALDASGNPIEPEVAFTTAIASYVKPFQYRITPRIGLAAELAQTEALSTNK